MIILTSLVLLLGFIYNFNKKAKIKIKPRPVYKGIIITFSLIVISTVLIFTKSLKLLILGLTASLFVYSFIFYQGINKDSVVVSIGPLLKKVSFDEILKINIKDMSNGDLTLDINAHGTHYRQVYREEDLETIKNILSKKL